MINYSMRSLDFQRKSEFAEIRQILHSMGKHIIFSSKVIREVCFYLYYTFSQNIILMS